MTQTLRIATRKSALALWQAEYVKTQLIACHPGLEVELLPMSTKGDILLDTPLSKVGGKGLFVKELEVAMLEGRADIAVHSMKDVPMEFPEGLELAVICEREDPLDAFVSNNYQTIEQLPELVELHFHLEQDLDVLLSSTILSKDKSLREVSNKPTLPSPFLSPSPLPRPPLP